MHTNKSDDIKPRESISDELTVDIVVSANSYNSLLMINIVLGQGGENSFLFLFNGEV